ESRKRERGDTLLRLSGGGTGGRDWKSAIRPDRRSSGMAAEEVPEDRCCVDLARGAAERAETDARAAGPGVAAAADRVQLDCAPVAFGIDQVIDRGAVGDAVGPDRTRRRVAAQAPGLAIGRLGSGEQ